MHTRFAPRTLGAKINLAMTILVIATVSGFSTWSIHREKQRFQQGLETKAATILNTMVAASKDAFYTKDFDGIENLLEKLTNELEDEKILTSGRAYQAQGRLISDAFVYDVSIYSLQPDRLGQYLVTTPDEITFLDGEELIAGRPIILAGQTLGAVSIGLSKESLNQKIVETRTQGVLIAIAAGAIGTILSHFLSRSITHPLDRLTAAIEKIENGQISQKLRVKSRDEIAVLAQAFNQMSDRLACSIAELEDRAAALQRSEAQASEKAIELEQALQDLHQAQGKLVHSEKMAGLGQLVAGIAHEINNPVSFITGNVEYAQAYTADLLTLMAAYRTEYPHPSSALEQQAQEVEIDFITEDLPRLLNSMTIGAKRIADIVRSLRTFSRLDESDQKRVNLHEGLESTLMILKHRLREQPNRPEIQLHKSYGDLPNITCYPGPLNQVFMNLSVNAIDALDDYWTEHQMAIAGTDNNQQQWRPQLWIETYTLGTNGVQISIQDNGPGIPDVLLEKIFDPFFTTKKIGHGTGLGLSISYQIIVDQHQGSLTCKSQPGEGTTFTLTIPV